MTVSIEKCWWTLLKFGLEKYPTFSIWPVISSTEGGHLSRRKWSALPLNVCSTCEFGDLIIFIPSKGRERVNEPRFTVACVTALPVIWNSSISQMWGTIMHVLISWSCVCQIGSYGVWVNGWSKNRRLGRLSIPTMAFLDQKVIRVLPTNLILKVEKISRQLAWN